MSPIKILVFMLFVIFGLAIFPMMISVFLFLETAIGNQDLGIVAFLREQYWYVVAGVWIFAAAGIAFALPAMLKSGFFNDIDSDDKK